MNITRRDALKSLGSAFIGGSALQCVAAESKPTMHAYQDYGWLRGLGIVPSWGANIVEAWQLYDGARFREEVALARTIHCNCIRLWIDFAAWKTDPAKITERFLDAVASVAENGMKVMPCLFNHWHDKKLDYGGTPLAGDWTPQFEYIKALVTPLVKDDRVMIWELCNEPGSTDNGTLEYKWMSQIAAAVRGCGTQQPVTIGTMRGKNITTFAPLMDVLNGHPYAHNRKALEVMITGYSAIQKEVGKPFMVNEAIPGALNDLVRAEAVRFHAEMLSAAGFGWMGWVIREGRALATRRDLPDGNGINGGGYHPFFTKDGKLRDGLEFLTEVPKLRAPWENTGAKLSN